jgi:hypothetical protein
MNANSDPVLIQKQVKTIRRHFTDDEDDIIRKEVETNGTKNWKHVAELVGNCNEKQVRGRYKFYLKDEINRGDFTSEEDQKILQLVQQFGTKWSVIETSFSDRDQNKIKNRYNRLKRQSGKVIKLSQDENQFISTINQNSQFESFEFNNNIDQNTDFSIWEGYDLDNDCSNNFNYFDPF